MARIGWPRFSPAWPARPSCRLHLPSRRGKGNSGSSANFDRRSLNTVKHHALKQRQHVTISHRKGNSFRALAKWPDQASSEFPRSSCSVAQLDCSVRQRFPLIRDEPKKKPAERSSAGFRRARRIRCLPGATNPDDARAAKAARRERGRPRSAGYSNDFRLFNGTRRHCWAGEPLIGYSQSGFPLLTTRPLSSRHRLSSARGTMYPG